jgi:Flp pilus assembly protein TadG
MINRSRRAERTWRSKTGVSSIEFAIIAPCLMVLLFGSFTVFAMIRDSYRVESATFTVADIVSRRFDVSKAFLDTTYAMFVRMLPTTQTGASFRVSSVLMTDKGLKVAWSYPIAPMTALTDPAIPKAKLPAVAVNDSLILVETRVGYAPLTSILGFLPGTHEYLAANRPRMTAAIDGGDVVKK